MAYVPSILEDRRLHRRYHDETLKGVPTRHLMTDRVVWQQGSDRITVVKFRSRPAQKNRANYAAAVAKRDTNFDFPPYIPSDRPDDSDLHIFLLYQGNLIIGLVALGKLPHL